MPIATTTELMDTLRSLLGGPAQRDAELLAEQFAEPAFIVSELVRRQRLSAYQADEILAGRGAHLRLGSYLLLEPIGKGGMGQVFRARQTVLERECAVKIVRRDRLQSSESIERFVREARAAARLKHPNIVAIYDADVAGGVHYLAMELLQGVTLSERVKHDGPLPIGIACRYVRQAALGLQHAFEQALVHRDIKPQNLFLEQPSDQIKILDLGLARERAPSDTEETATADLTREGDVMGTPDYMAPEQALDARSADHRADIYSLGCTLYFLITGRPPFPEGSLTQKLLAHQQREPIPLERLLPGAPEAIIAVLKRAMAKQPGDRFRTPAELADALAPLEHVEQIAAAPPMAAVSPSTLMPAAPSATALPTPNIARPRRTWLVVLALLTLLSCCPLAILGGGAFVVSLFVIAPAHDQKMPGERANPPVIDAGVALKVPKPIAKPDGPLVTSWRAFDGRGFLLSAGGTHMIHDLSEGQFAFEVREFMTGKHVRDVPKGERALGFVTGKPPYYVSSRDATAIFVRDLEIGTERRKFINSFQGFTEVVSIGESDEMVAAVDKFLCVWDLAQGKEKSRSRLPDFAHHVSVTPKGEVALFECQNLLRTWSIADGVPESEYLGFQGRITCTAITGDGKRLLAGSDQGNIYLWQADDPKNPRVLQRHVDRVYSADFSPDGSRILSGGQDGKLILWDAAKGVALDVVDVGGMVTKVAIHPSGEYAVSAGTDKKIRTWRLSK